MGRPANMIDVEAFEGALEEVGAVVGKLSARGALGTWGRREHISDRIGAGECRIEPVPLGPPPRVGTSEAGALYKPARAMGPLGGERDGGRGGAPAADVATA